MRLRFRRTRARSRLELEMLNLCLCIQFEILITSQVWTDVYAALDGIDVNVVGGRVTGPGVGGFSLGGGYS